MPSKQPKPQPTKKDLNPRNMAAASRLLRMGPEAVDNAISDGLGADELRQGFRTVTPKGR